MLCLFRSQAARGKEGIKDGVSEMGTRLDPVPGLPGGKPANTGRVGILSASMLSDISPFTQRLHNMAVTKTLLYVTCFFPFFFVFFVFLHNKNGIAMSPHFIR